MSNHKTKPALLIGASLLTAGLGIETWKKKSRPCGLPYGVMCNCFRCLRARMKAVKEYERMPNAALTCAEGVRVEGTVIRGGNNETE